MTRREFLEQYVLNSARGAGARPLNVDGAVAEARKAWAAIDQEMIPWRSTREGDLPRNSDVVQAMHNNSTRPLRHHLGHWEFQEALSGRWMRVDSDSNVTAWRITPTAGE